ncbi:hypothetical protein BESB_001870 [Besnoitia besnoiti]|uniref:Uncharacterized protein n=1 Tax=Besnoitia besnoiti TaxID=94643 RepID=A0A2A9MIN5_BESBE|nr:hypothetical protein BESB_001870 [Besnoitia besnoiti]PFH37845.1 hypothetical protein BESB_001870 [Besnoitia besnoiti]
MQLSDLPTGFSSRYIQDKRRMKIASASDIDVSEFSLPPTAHARRDPREQLTPLDLLAIRPSPSVTARARAAAAASLLRRPRAPVSNSVPAATDRPGGAVALFRARSGASGGFPSSADGREAGQARREEIRGEEGRDGRGRAADSARGKGNLASSGCGDLSGDQRAVASAGGADFYVELSRIARETGFTLEAETVVQLALQQRAGDDRSRPPSSGAPSAATSPAKGLRRDTRTLRRVLPDAARQNQRNGGFTAGGWGWKDNREAVKEVYRQRVTVERSSSPSLFSFSVVPEEDD